jgi:hypothetical protein
MLNPCGFIDDAGGGARTLTKVGCFPQIRRFLETVSSDVSSGDDFSRLRIPQTQTHKQAKKMKKYRIPY